MSDSPPGDAPLVEQPAAEAHPGPATGPEIGPDTGPDTGPETDPESNEGSANDFGKIDAPNVPFLSPEEAEYLTEMYRAPQVILEYGSGGSTRIAAAMPGKRIFSVESDPDWARALQSEIDALPPASLVTVYPVDIGPVGPWGRPLSAEHWRRFVRYPTAIWDEPFFRHPDLILIDGRMRCACLVHAMMRIERPVTVLFDDYGARRLYRQVERLIAPTEMIGTMARFDLRPDMLAKEDLSFAIGQFFVGSLHGSGEEFYECENPR